MTSRDDDIHGDIHNEEDGYLRDDITGDEIKNILSGDANIEDYLDSDNTSDDSLNDYPEEQQYEQPEEFMDDPQDEYTTEDVIPEDDVSLDNLYDNTDNTDNIDNIDKADIATPDDTDNIMDTSEEYTEDDPIRDDEYYNYSGDYPEDVNNTVVPYNIDEDDVSIEDFTNYSDNNDDQEDIAYWSDTGEDTGSGYDEYKSIDHVAPEDSDINTGFPEYDPSEVDYDASIFNSGSYDDEEEDDGSISKGVKILSIIVALLSILFLSWLGWWLIDGKDNNQFFPWQNTSESSTDKQDEGGFGIDSIFGKDNNDHNSTAPSVTESTDDNSDSDSSNTSSTDSNSPDIASLEKQVEDLKRKNDKLEKDLSSARSESHGSTITRSETSVTTETVTETSTDVRNNTVTAPPVTITRTNTVDRPVPGPTITRTVTAPAPAPVTRTVTREVPGPRVTVTTTVRQWIG